MNERIYVALDVETTGLQAGVDEIIEVAAVKFRGTEILDRYSQLVAPFQPLPLKISRLTGIKPEDLASAPRFNEIGSDIAQFVKSYPIIGHSVSFDLTMLCNQGMSFNQPVYDTFDMATLLMPQIAVYRLSAIADRLGIPHPADHRALNDAEVTAQLFNYLLGLIANLDIHQLVDLRYFTTKVALPIHELFDQALHARSKQVFLEAEADRAVDTEAMIEPAPDILIGTREYSPLYPTGNTSPISPDAITRFFAAQGMLSRFFSGYELRQPQVQMAHHVGDAFNSGYRLIVEAGTGTGKSLAYLVPAVLFAVQRGERVVISTNTINLQDQLFYKDIPDLQRIIANSPPQYSHGADIEGMGVLEQPLSFTAALLKGRSNYLCLKRYYEMRRSEKLSPEEVRALLKVQLWLPTTTSGDRAELLLMDREALAWSRMNVTPETCTGARCKNFRECFFFRARHKAEAAHIVVVNHALLIADLAAPSDVIPAYDHLIVDEAHNLEDVATDQFSFTIDQAALFTFLDDLYQEGGAQTVSGLLADLPKYLRESAADPDKREKIEQIVQKMPPSLIRARVAIETCFDLLAGFIATEVEANQYDSRVRLIPSVRNKPAWITIQQAWQNLIDSIIIISDGLNKIEQLLRDLRDASIPSYDELQLRITMLSRFIGEVRVKTGHIIFGDNTDSVCWLSQDRLRNTLTLFAAPLSVSELLQSMLFTMKQTIILTSATLTVEGSFDFVCTQLGVTDMVELVLESPFDYEQQAIVFIPNDIPEPNQRGYQQSVEQALIELCSATGGRTLALFTANSALKQTYAAIQDELEEYEIAVLGQNIDGSRRSLLERFKEFPRTVLLGTSSFWEGVDVVGDALSVLVIAKLPFAVPTDPIYAARSEMFAEPFSQYSVPLSILKFKQGFGRLIRSREDHGVVVILDKRLISKKYGQQFLASLPHTRVRTGPLKQLPTIAAKFVGPQTDKTAK